jgi:hypothetical protein
MAALNKTARKDGHKQMELSITAAAGVRRRLRAGRPRAARSLQLNAYEAMGRIVGDADRARTLMAKAGLDPDDIRLGLIISAEPFPLCMRLPAPTEAGEFFKAIEGLEEARFLGILWEQEDREVAADEPGFTLWITPFVAEPEAQKRLLALAAYIRATGARMN